MQGEHAINTSDIDRIRTEVANLIFRTFQRYYESSWYGRILKSRKSLHALALNRF